MQEDNSKIVAVPTSQLKNNPYNPNQQSVDSFTLLCKSIEEDGFTLPVIVNSGITHPHLKDMIIDGEHRWRAALVLAMPEVPVVYKDMDEASMRTATLRHNKARGHHDALLEAQVLKSLVGEIGVQELSEGLNIDPVALDVMLDKASDYTSMSDLASLNEAETLEMLESQGLTGEAASTIAHRHGIIDSTEELSKQNNAQLSNESGQNVRIDFVYSGEEAAFMRSLVGKYGSARETVMALVSL